MVPWWTLLAVAALVGALAFAAGGALGYSKGWEDRREQEKGVAATGADDVG